MPPAEAAALRVLSFNIRNGRALDGLNSWPFRRAAVAATIADSHPHIAALQEVFGFQERWLVRRLPGWRSDGVGRGDGGRRGERCLVLSRTQRLAVDDVTTRWFGERPDEPGGRLPGATFPRTATLVRLEDRQTGDRFGVACTHLDERHADNRQRSAAQLVTWLDRDIPWIVAGDFNAEPGDALFEHFAEAGLVSALDPGQPGTDHRFTGRLDGPRIDHILVTGEWEVIEGCVDHRRRRGRLPSDHWPVRADLVLRR